MSRRSPKSINGGLNGLADRNAILDKAKQLLGAEFVPELLEQATHSVTATSLNLRSRPKVSPATRICSLPEGTQVALLEKTQPEWAKVRAVLNGHIVEGFVATKYIRPLPKPAEPVAVTTDRAASCSTHSSIACGKGVLSSISGVSRPFLLRTKSLRSIWAPRLKRSRMRPEGGLKIRVVLNGKTKEGYVSGKYLQPLAEAPTELTLVPQETSIDFEISPVHMTENRTNITRRRDGGRAYPLGEANRPGRSGGKPENRVKSVLKIIKYLNSENSQHQRYQPKQKTTYCNIYAYDFCYLAGVYLPRVWWTDKALLQIKDDVEVPVQYA